MDSKYRQFFKLIKDGFDSVSKPKVQIVGAELVTIKGEKGDKGDKGDSIKGEKGDKGDKGDTGADSVVPGPKGDKGDTGETGPKGEDSFIPGPQGAIGPKGEDGSPDTPDQIVEKIQTVKKAWLSIEAIDGDFNAKIGRRQFGGGNGMPLEVYGSTGLIGGVREIEFTGNGVATEVENNRLVVTIIGGGAYIVDDEIPSGAINGVNTIYTLTHTPNPSTSVKVHLNGQKILPTTQFTVSGNQITMVVAPETGDIITVDYRYI